MALPTSTPTIPRSLPSVAQRIPPHSLEAEQSVLGALLLDKDAILKVADFLTPLAFYQDSHRVIYEAMLQLFESREPIDVLSVSEKLKITGELERLGGTSTLTSLVNGVPSAAHVQHYGKIVQQKATLRRLITAANEINEMSFKETEDVESILDTAEQKLFQVSQAQLKQNFVPLKSILTETFERIDELHRNRGQLRGIATGFTDLDELLAGLQRSNLVVLAARPSMGKTTFALDIVRNIVTKLKQPVGFFSLEMSRDELVDRLLASQAQLDLWRLRTGRLAEREGDNDFERLNEAMAELSEAPLYIDDSASSNVMELRTKARRLHSEHKLSLIVVDYLQLMEGRQTENRVQEVSEISRALKGIARELNVPVLALSQLSRAVEQREPKIPQLSDLRESGSIEQDADVVMFIYRESMYKPDSKRPHIAEIHVRKHRNGPTGTIELFFNAQQVRFQNLAKPTGNRPPVGSPPPLQGTSGSVLPSTPPPLTPVPAAA
ncbi:MAG: replicative DNA helicase [Candidatus Andersenbacteria bacterium]